MLIRFVFGHSVARAFGLALLGIASNVLAGAYMFEITKVRDGAQFLDWRHSPESNAFWSLVVVLLLIAAYGWGMARSELKARTAMTPSEVRDRIMERLLNSLLKAVDKQIASGTVGSMDEAMKLFGIDDWRNP